MAYAQWATFTISTTVKLTVKNVTSNWGKFYRDGNKDAEISRSDIEGHNIEPGEAYTISTCGREHSASGTEGNFDLYDGTKKVGNYYWDCPWGRKENISRWTPADPPLTSRYVTQVTGGNLDSGALGNVFIVCVKKP